MFQSNIQVETYKDNPTSKTTDWHACTETQAHETLTYPFPVICDDVKAFPLAPSYPEQGKLEKSLVQLESYLPPKTLSPLPQQ